MGSGPASVGQPVGLISPTPQSKGLFHVWSIMAGDWIKFEVATLDKPEVRQMARVLGVKHGEALELLLRFWAWIDANSVDGHVDGLVDRDVDELMHCQGFSGVMQMIGWLKVDNEAQRVEIPNAGRHTTESAKKRALRNRNQSNWRDNVDVDVDREQSTQRSKKVSTREEKRRDTSSLRSDVVPPTKKSADILQSPTDEHKDLAEKSGIDCFGEWQKYLDWQAASGNHHKDRSAGFRNWLKNSKPHLSAKRGGQSREDLVAAVCGASPVRAKVIDITPEVSRAVIGMD
jgi:hypothetical protein